MNKITIIGLGLVGNSLGMALKKADPQGQTLRVTGFDPERGREEAALRRYFSVDEIAPDLERAVRGAHLVIIATPAKAVREVIGAIAPLLDEGTTVTDTISAKEQVMSWAGELLPSHASFVAGHPFSKLVDIETEADSAAPRADLFQGAPYAIMPSPTAHEGAFGMLVAVAEMVGAKPLFIDPLEHDSFTAAVSQLPVVASAALLQATAKSPAWEEMRGFAQEQYRSATECMAGDMAALAGGLTSNRRSLIRWIDQYMLALQDMRDLLASDDPEVLASALADLQETHEALLSGKTGKHDELRAELREAIDDARPSRSLLGSYLSDRIFRKKERE